MGADGIQILELSPACLLQKPFGAAQYWKNSVSFWSDGEERKPFAIAEGRINDRPEKSASLLDDDPSVRE